MKMTMVNSGSQGLTAGLNYIRAGFHFLLPHQVPPNKHVKDNTSISKIRKYLPTILSNLNNFHALKVVDRASGKLLLLCQRRRRWANIKPALFGYLVFAGYRVTFSMVQCYIACRVYISWLLGPNQIQGNNNYMHRGKVSYHALYPRLLNKALVRS